jgi:glycosyltransferase involved in cell wall biosynthesis
MSIKFSIAIAVHNEEKILPLTLPSVYALEPNEVIFGLDRCTDNTRKIIETEAFRHKSKTILIEYTDKDGMNWNFRRAFLRWDTNIHATNEVIVNSAGDIRLDPHLREILKLIPSKYRLVSLGYLDYPWTLQTFLRYLAAKSHLFYGFSGVFAVSRSAWLETESLEDLKKIYIGEDTHLHQAVRGKYPTLYTNTSCLHLRPNENKSHHYRRGVAQWESLRKSYLQSFIHSFLLLRPAVFTGYRHARSGAITASKIAYLPVLFPEDFKKK